MPLMVYAQDVIILKDKSTISVRVVQEDKESVLYIQQDDPEKKVKQLHVLTGEIAQLKANEQVIINLIENMVAAAERDIARRETMDKLKAAREVQEERRQAVKDAAPSEQADTVETDAEDVKQD